MLEFLHRPETTGFRLLRAIGSTISLFGFVLLLIALAATMTALLTDVRMGVGTLPVGAAMLWLFLIGMAIVAAGQLLHLAVAIWRALERQ